MIAFSIIVNVVDVLVIIAKQFVSIAVLDLWPEEQVYIK